MMLYMVLINQSSGVIEFSTLKILIFRDFMVNYLKLFFDVIYMWADS